jgi:hypothetical protein
LYSKFGNFGKMERKHFSKAIRFMLELILDQNTYGSLFGSAAGRDCLTKKKFFIKGNFPLTPLHPTKMTTIKSKLKNM